MELNIHYGFNWPMTQGLVLTDTSLPANPSSPYFVPKSPLSEAVSSQTGHWSHRLDKQFPTWSVVDVTGIVLPAAGSVQREIGGRVG